MVGEEEFTFSTVDLAVFLATSAGQLRGGQSPFVLYLTDSFSSGKDDTSVNDFLFLLFNLFLFYSSQTLPNHAQVWSYYPMEQVP